MTTALRAGSLCSGLELGAALSLGPTLDRRPAASQPVPPPRRHSRWRPTARSEHGRHVQAARHRQALIQAISQRGQQLRADAGQVLAAMQHADALLRARGWHPDQFPYGDPVDDFVTGLDADYADNDQY